MLPGMIGYVLYLLVDKMSDGQRPDLEANLSSIVEVNVESGQIDLLPEAQFKACLLKVCKGSQLRCLINAILRTSCFTHDPQTILTALAALLTTEEVEGEAVASKYKIESLAMLTSQLLLNGGSLDGLYLKDRANLLKIFALPDDGVQPTVHLFVNHLMSINMQFAAKAAISILPIEEDFAALRQLLWDTDAPPYGESCSTLSHEAEHA